MVWKALRKGNTITDNSVEKEEKSMWTKPKVLYNLEAQDEKQAERPDSWKITRSREDPQGHERIMF